MVLDEKLLDDSSLDRMSIFAETFPDLAKHVKRLQRRLSPLFFNGVIFGDTYFDHVPAAQVPSRPEDITPNHQLMRQLLARFGTDPWDEEAFAAESLCCLKSRTAFQRTIWALPKLVHVENTISTSWLPSVRAMARQCNSEFDEILEHLLVPDNQVPNHSLVHMYDHLSEQITSTVKSMKLLQYPVFAKPYYQAIGGWEHPTTEFQWSGALLNLEHLDLECRLDASPLEEIQGEAWDGLENDAWRLRAGLRKMTNLRSLRLSCSGSWDDINMMTTTWWDGTNGTHVDDLLHGFTFPYLNSLSLINWPVRESRLAEIIRRYRSNLKTLELQRLTIEIIDPESFGGRNTPWHRIAAVCAECINVHRFSFKDLRYHSSNLRADQPLTGPPVSPRVQEQADIEEYYRIARREMADEDMPDRLISEEEERVEADAIDEED